MKKKTAKKKKLSKQKIDVVLESLANLEKQVKELIKKVETLQPNYPTFQPPKDANKYWPNHPHDMKWNPPEYN